MEQKKESKLFKGAPLDTEAHLKSVENPTALVGFRLVECGQHGRCLYACSADQQFRDPARWQVVKNAVLDRVKQLAGPDKDAFLVQTFHELVEQRNIDPDLVPDFTAASSVAYVAQCNTDAQYRAEIDRRFKEEWHFANYLMVAVLPDIYNRPVCLFSPHWAAPIIFTGTCAVAGDPIRLWYNGIDHYKSVHPIGADDWVTVPLPVPRWARPLMKGSSRAASLFTVVAVNDGAEAKKAQLGAAEADAASGSAAGFRSVPLSIVRKELARHGKPFDKIAVWDDAIEKLLQAWLQDHQPLTQEIQDYLIWRDCFMTMLYMCLTQKVPAPPEYLVHAQARNAKFWEIRAASSAMIVLVYKATDTIGGIAKVRRMLKLSDFADGFPAELQKELGDVFEPISQLRNRMVAHLRDKQQLRIVVGPGGELQYNYGEANDDSITRSSLQFLAIAGYHHVYRRLYALLRLKPHPFDLKEIKLETDGKAREVAKKHVEAQASAAAKPVPVLDPEHPDVSLYATLRVLSEDSRNVLGMAHGLQTMKDPIWSFGLASSCLAYFRKITEELEQLAKQHPKELAFLHKPTIASLCQRARELRSYVYAHAGTDTKLLRVNEHGEVLYAEFSDWKGLLGAMDIIHNQLVQWLARLQKRINKVWRKHINVVELPMKPEKKKKPDDDSDGGYSGPGLFDDIV